MYTMEIMLFLWTHCHFTCYHFLETHGEVEEGEPPLPGGGRGLADEGRLPGVHQGSGGVREEDHSGLAVQHHLRAHHEAQAATAGKA